MNLPHLSDIPWYAHLIACFVIALYAALVLALAALPPVLAKLFFDRLMSRKHSTSSTTKGNTK
ncbi:hypothetical protein [Methylobacterium radiotolerans]|uniref:hypothetical protein n=1 Tax=Methylobacterium radiotolerans TaxID=31998 RepID=UPI0011BFA00A|nr:hypothetical protein [Methylobacterium radiotolerans]